MLDEIIAPGHVLATPTPPAITPVIGGSWSSFRPAEGRREIVAALFAHQLVSVDGKRPESTA
jgi:hypothetical protein